MNPDVFVLFGKPHTTLPDHYVLLGITDSLDVEVFASWSDAHDRKDICCLVSASKAIWENPSIEHRTYYTVHIHDSRGVIPGTEEDCSWFGSSYVSAEEALHDALKEFHKTAAFVDKVKKMFEWGILND